MLRFHTLTRRLLDHQRRSTTVNESIRCHRLLRLQNLLHQTLDQTRNPTIKEWHQLQENLLMHGMHGSNQAMINKLILDHCFPDKLDIGKSYIDYLKESKQRLHRSIWINMLNLYYSASKCGIRITAQQQRHIIEMCQYLHGTHSTFSTQLGEAIIQGLMLTPDWRESLELLDSRKIAKPPKNAYDPIVERAIQEKDDRLVWEIFEKVIAERVCLNDKLFALYIGYCESNECTFKENIDRMLTLIGTNRLRVPVQVANEFQRAFRRFRYSCTVTSVSERGECHQCGKRLRSDVKLTDEEWDSLRHHFWTKISTKSTPRELESFKPFIDGTRTYDIVIDGLNLRLSSWRRGESDYEQKLCQLTKVVEYYADRQKRVLVIGREYMSEWSTSHIDYIKQHADLFLTDNSSEDDEFFIYSALKSGPNTCIITRDALQNHAVGLDEKLRTVFRRWQQQNQYSIKSIDDSSGVIFDERVDFDMNVQQMDDGCWHMPFGSSTRFIKEHNLIRLCKNWMCVSSG